MLREIQKELAAALRAKNVPIPVVFGPERAPSNLSERIVIERDRDGGDGLGPARSQRQNPKMRFVRMVGCVARIYAKSPVTGAQSYDHERRADAIVDRVLVCLDDVIRVRQTMWTLESGKLVATTDLEGTETWPGALYELRFSVDRAVLDLTWPTTADPQGAARPEGSPDLISNELDLHTSGGDIESIPFGKVN